MKLDTNEGPLAHAFLLTLIETFLIVVSLGRYSHTNRKPVQPQQNEHKQCIIRVFMSLHETEQPES